MDQSEEIAYLLLGAFLYFFIFFQVIVGAVKSASKSQNYNLKTQNRLLIKMLQKQGVSKKELVDLHNSDTDEFWKSIEDDKSV